MLATITLGDGRTVEYAELGVAGGPPVVFFHGTPATGGQAAVLADAATGHGVRLIAPTRPGYGDSTLSPPGLAATAADTWELLDLLGLDRVALLGGSGGGPFALAAAAHHPERVVDLQLGASPGRLAETSPDALTEGDVRALDLAAAGDVDEAMRLMDAVVDDDLADLRGLSRAEFAEAMSTMAPPGGGWLGRHPELRQAFQADFQRSILTSAGMSRDNLSWLRDWDVDLARVTTPARLVYADADRMVEPANGEWLHARLPDSRLEIVPGDHGAAVFGGADPFFASLVGKA